MIATEQGGRADGPVRGSCWREACWCCSSPPSRAGRCRWAAVRPAGSATTSPTARSTSRRHRSRAVRSRCSGASIAGPYAAYADGDPYATKCERNGTVSPEACSAGIYTGGATNQHYTPTGYEFAVTVKAADVGKPLSLQVWDAGSYPRTVGASSTNDCATNAAPFTSAPYSGVVGPDSCQTGDTGVAPFELQLFDNDGDDLTIDFTTPIVPCRLFVAPAAAPGTYKNKWATVCTFTPTTAGVFPLRVKSSNIAPPGGPAVPDTGDGANSFALPGHRRGGHHGHRPRPARHQRQHARGRHPLLPHRRPLAGSGQASPDRHLRSRRRLDGRQLHPDPGAAGRRAEHGSDRRRDHPRPRPLRARAATTRSPR